MTKKSNKKILIVEDDDFFRSTLVDVLSDNFQILQAPNGRSACEILSIQEVDLVLTDIQMPGFSGVELFEWSKKNKPVPFVIMTGFSTLLETKSAFEMGAKGFIAKPFKIAELMVILNSALPSAKEEPKVDKKNVSDFCRVSIDEFVSKPKIDFDVYIKLSENNIIKIAQKNEELSRQQLAQYKIKGVKHLYILKEDFSKLVQFNLELVKVMKDRSDIPQEKKMSFVKYTGEVILEKTFSAGLDKENLNEVSSFVGLTVESVSESKDNFDLLNILNSHSDVIYAHSVAVSMFAVMLAKQMGFESNVTLFKLCMAGLFHDVGKKEIDKEILLKPRHLVTKEERKLIESHVVRGQEILTSMKTIPSDVARLVYEHHEDLEGMGYPSGKSRKDQHPLSRILQCANIFVDQVNLVKDDNQEVAAKQVIEHISTIYGNRVDAECLMAFKKIFNLS